MEKVVLVRGLEDSRPLILLRLSTQVTRLIVIFLERRLHQMNMNDIVSKAEEKLFTGPKPEEQEIREKAAEQAEGLKIATKTQAPITAHVEEIRRIVASMDKEDAKAALDVLVIKHPFVVIDSIKEYFEKMDEDLKGLRKVFTEREQRESDICGGDRI